MATTTLTLNPQTITVPANTNEHDINFKAMLPTRSGAQFHGYAIINRVSGTSVKFSNAAAIDTGGTSGALTADIPRLTIPLLGGYNLKYKGGAGSEVFTITITPHLI